jgi:hypothetical protein
MALVGLNQTARRRDQTRGLGARGRRTAEVNRWLTLPDTSSCSHAQAPEPAEALIQASGACHNDVLDQTISRARFDIALDRMSRAQLDLAIARIELPRDAPLAMPPPEGRQLAPAARDRLLEFYGAISIPGRSRRQAAGGSMHFGAVKCSTRRPQRPACRSR